MPLVNPDGYEYTHTTDRTWKKNRRQDPTCENSVGGVNLNVNFGFMWDGGSRNSCDIVYGGQEPFSEPETRAVREYITKAKEEGVNWQAYFSLHSFGQVWLLPWGFQRDYPEDHMDLVRFATEGVTALTARFGTSYRIIALADFLNGKKYYRNAS